jgi:hypothetical protein
MKRSLDNGLAPALCDAIHGKLIADIIAFEVLANPR